MTDSEAVTHQSVPIHLVIFDLANRVGFKVATSLVTLVSDWDRSSDGRSIWWSCPDRLWPYSGDFWRHQLASEASDPIWSAGSLLTLFGWIACACFEQWAMFTWQAQCLAEVSGSVRLEVKSDEGWRFLKVFHPTFHQNVRTSTWMRSQVIPWIAMNRVKAIRLPGYRAPLGFDIGHLTSLTFLKARWVKIVKLVPMTWQPRKCFESEELAKVILQDVKQASLAG